MKNPPLLLAALLMMACTSSSAETALTSAEQSGSQSAIITGESADSTDPAVGRALYRDGLRANGEPLTAIVADDVEVLGTQFSCDGCHGISGMGSREASYIVPIIAGPVLFSPAVQPERPAYDPDSLATVLREGISPSSRKLDRLMPRYRLSDDEIRSLAAYLDSLTTGPDPGVDDSTIRFATVVTDKSNEQERNAILSVLNRFAEEKSRQTRLESKRWDRGTTPESQLPTVHRDWILDVWVLSGPVETWGDQLQAYQERAPVFAVLGGLLPEAPGPLARFCEANKIPCLLPSTKNPETRENDLYTLYFSRGLGLEADLIATHLQDYQFDTLIQVYCEDSAARAAEQLDAVYAGREIESRQLAFDCENEAPAEQWQRLPGESQTNVVSVLWLDKGHLAKIETPPEGRVYLSSTLISDDIDALPEVSASAYLAHPYRLPGAIDPAYRRFLAWMKTRKIEVTNPRLQGEAFFAALLMSDVVKHMDGFYVREYVLDLIGHAQGMALYLPGYSQPTFGPGQIFLTKGGYILPVSQSRVSTESSSWISPSSR
jgi:mono/diheme cytochrome c family protein